MCIGVQCTVPLYSMNVDGGEDLTTTEPIQAVVSPNDDDPAKIDISIGYGSEKSILICLDPADLAKALRVCEVATEHEEHEEDSE